MLLFGSATFGGKLRRHSRSENTNLQGQEKGGQFRLLRHVECNNEAKALGHTEAN